MTGEDALNRQQADFDHIARPYRYLEYLTLGPTLQQTRTHFLPLLLDRKHALLLGDGDGRFLAKLLASNLTLNAVAVDTSATMLQLLCRRCSPYRARLQTINRNALTLTPTGKVDLIITHFFLDCLTQAEVDALINSLAPHISPDTLWLISDFRLPAGLLRVPARLSIRALYLAFRLFTGLRITHLPNHETPLKHAGFIRTHQHRKLFGLLTTELWTHRRPNTDQCG